ncbi:4Fe-4S dicluster domain-containing protein [Desulfocurvibacter africanus]|uniref:Hydrogenase, putative n=1 Tax=Desulfocurvibacter africanus subsp. africanus str. Walvis Bay TaxID=690850 RepID=F3Z1Q5_DESAF|nr:4Fe-4S dicluster domain-containing protein [Desulfocurvibacter africanus]EGJ51190.1 hydrogenase, putative [Desulfocurvibacter africanus subsp. africanus str. Walvis Bay]
MAQAKFLKEADLAAWLGELAKGRKVLVPQKDGDAVVFKPWHEGVKPVLDRQATESPKKAVFPASEKLFRFSYIKDPENPGKVRVELEEPEKPEPALVFGGRPCDARGFLIFDRVYDSPKTRDSYYVARREATAFVTLACPEASNTCFCHAVGSGPADSAGSDALMTPVEGGYVLEAISPKGEELLKSPLLSDAGDKLAQAERVKAQAVESLPPAPDFAGSPEALMARFDDMGFWENASAKCISCGACTYLCPTCYCFSITDEESGMKGVRMRSWDNCMSYQFTLEASGHNPRPTKAHRLKNRVGHKFSYYPLIHKGAIACCGCGRCIKSCPVSVDIREIVTMAIEAAPTAEESAQPQGAKQ